MDDAQEKNTGWLVWLLSGLTLALLAGGIYYRNQNQQLIRQSDLSEQTADSLTSVKLQLEDDLQRLTSKLETATETQVETNQRLRTVSDELASRGRAMNTLTRDKRIRIRAIDQLTQQLARTQTTYMVSLDSMGNQMKAMTGKISWLTDSTRVMAERNTQLDGDLKQVNARMLTMVPQSLLTGDNFRVEAQKPNRKETAKAKKVNTLTISLNVPAELGLSGQQEVYLSLTDEQHNAAMPPLRTLTVTLPTVNDVVPIHAVQSVTFGAGSQRIVFSLQPSNALKPGLYRASIYTKDMYLGSVEYRFRDSFWFF